MKKLVLIVFLHFIGRSYSTSRAPEGRLDPVDHEELVLVTESVDKVFLLDKNARKQDHHLRFNIINSGETQFQLKKIEYNEKLMKIKLDSNCLSSLPSRSQCQVSLLVSILQSFSGKSSVIFLFQNKNADYYGRGFDIVLE